MLRLFADRIQHELRRGGELVLTARNEAERAYTQRQISHEHRQEPCLTVGLDRKSVV